MFLATTLLLGTIACVLAFFAGQAIFSTKDVDESFTDPYVARAVFGCGLFLAAMGAFGLALGALLRNTAAAITTLTLLLFVVPAIVDSARRGDQIGPYLPSSRGADDHGRLGDRRAQPVGGIRPVVRVGRRYDRPRRRPSGAPRRVNRLTRHPLLADLLLTLVLLGLGVVGAHGSARWFAAALACR